MGLLVNSAENRRVYLKSSHTLGRDAGSVDTVISNPMCSRLQCLFRYHQDNWVIEDKSKNGTWLNGRRLKSGKTPLCVGDSITFPGENDQVWVLSDDSFPRPFLIDKVQEHFLELDDGCNILPNENNPELLITKQDNSWIVEQGEKAHFINGGSTLIFDKVLWHFYPNDVMYDTLTQIIGKQEASDPQLKFDVSLNEENVQLSAKLGDTNKNFGYKAHHVLLLELARRRIDDEKAEISIHEQGWLSTDVLIQELGIEPNHMNILIYRARKTFESNGFDVAPVERRQGEIRLSTCRFSIRKGDNIFTYDCG